MEPTPDQLGSIEAAMQEWWQGDCVLDPSIPFVHLADLATPLSQEASATAKENPPEEGADSLEVVVSEMRGLAVLSQTCDLRRSPKNRPFVEAAPLVEVQRSQFDLIRRNRMPAYAFIPALASQRLVAHLERAMTMEKSVLAGRARTPGLGNDDERRDFADQIGRKRSRFAFPTEFVLQIAELRKRFLERGSKSHAEGAHWRAVREIRIRARPSWSAAIVFLTFWFIVDAEPEGHSPNWDQMVGEWIKLVPFSDQYKLEFAGAVRPEDISTRDYIDSDRLELGG